MTRIELLRELQVKIQRCPEEAAYFCGEMLLLRMEMCCDILAVLDSLPNEDLSCTRQVINVLGIADNKLLIKARTVGEYREVVLEESDALAEVALDKKLFENFVTEYQKLASVLELEVPQHYTT